ncbi:hypothetical protein CfE428DRAFT_4987 [Chthoniobacter flavus Ellin428]|uniref:Type 4 fimbrial biogenesis protein PilX N-terminal domain-containing protein n=1 Tax=Chthoniobacter flavus Ellin428 TaxID=497964 RepID=B4D7U7_9BACT|nr:hypothetical protein [Chthoniobacter flavus]EDY17470.1 hypothetical protein CfE428DRAFT_4987 [Chthoniobacter flavus Ellin428]TCO92266.1 hypothetical protein EV701_10635 [Chthoniobacter flavus]
MKTSSKESGSILLSVLMIVTVSIAIVGAAYVSTTNQGQMTSRSADMDALQVTAEGVLDYTYGVWKSSLEDNGKMLDAAGANALVSETNLPAVPANMQILGLTLTPIDSYGVPQSAVTYANDYRTSLVYNYLATVELRTTGVGGGRRVKMQRNFYYSSLPPTRGMFFSQGDFELYKPAKMVIGGNVHTNANAHVSTGTQPVLNADGSVKTTGLEFLPTSNVTHVGSYDNNAPPGATNWNNQGTNYAPTYDNGFSKQVKQVPDMSGIGLGTAAVYDTTDNNPNNDGNHEMIEPPVAGYTDPAPIANSRLYNTAGILIDVTGPVDTTASLANSTGNTFSGGNITITGQNGTTLTSAQATAIRNAVSNSTVTQKQVWVPKLVTQQVWVSNWVWVTSGYYTTSRSGKKTWVDTSGYVDQGGYQTQTVDQGSYVTQNVTVQTTLYDKRESQSIPITNLDVGAVNPTLNSLNSFNGIIYMYDTGSGSKNAIRVTDGGVLPNAGLTIATLNGLYVQGDYNVGTTNPNQVPSNASPGSGALTYYTPTPGYIPPSAALVGDAVMVLSNSWSDSNASSSVGSRLASNTTLNTALIGGYIPSTSTGTGGRSGYSGGMNNFPRFLETWTNDSMTFSGAFVSLYQSQTFTAEWDTGDIYAPPTRYWYFDTMLLTRVLPGIPSTGGCSRGPITRLPDIQL